MGRPFLVLLLMIAAPATAQSLTVDWWTVDGGGGTSSGATFAMTGTVGQPDAGASAGGQFALSSGFWSVTSAAIQPTPPPRPTRTATPILTATPTASPVPASAPGTDLFPALLVLAALLGILRGRGGRDRAGLAES